MSLGHILRRDPLKSQYPLAGWYSFCKSKEIILAFKEFLLD
jgi:hypothetical protein